MKDPLTRLFYIGVLGCGVSTAMIAENYISKSNTTWEYIISFVLLAFSLAFIISSFIIGKKKRK